MSTQVPKGLLAVDYEEAAQAYLRSLPLEHFMEATAQATQRKITLESFDLVAGRRADVQVFNELLVQYPLGRGRAIKQIVPDNMIVKSEIPVEADTSFNLPLEPTPPFWVMEYVSKHNRRKDYFSSFRKYERHLKVPYYLIFYPDAQDLALYRHDGQRYVSVPENERGRHPVPELEMEVALHDGWVRYWYQGELLPLPAEMQRELDAYKLQLEAAKLQMETVKRQAEAAKVEVAIVTRQAEAAKVEVAIVTRQAEAAKVEAAAATRQAEAAKVEAAAATRQAEAAQVEVAIVTRQAEAAQVEVAIVTRQAEAAKVEAAAATRQAEAAMQQAEAAKQHTDGLEQRLKAEQEARQTLERELARLRAQVAGQ